MRILAVDSSTPFLYTAIYDKNGTELKLSEQKIEPISLKRDDWLSRAVAGFDFNRLDAIALGCGPGSFTGLRVSFSYMRTRAMLEKLPVYLFSSLHLWYNGFSEDENDLLLTRINRRMYYGFSPRQPGFLHGDTAFWQRHITGNLYRRVMLWPETWRRHISEESTGLEDVNNFRPVSVPAAISTLPPLKEPEDERRSWDAEPFYGHEPEFIPLK